MPASDEPAPVSPVFTIFMIVALLAVWGLVQDVMNTARGGSIDLRNRITGIRLATDHRDPYFYKWKPTEPERFCDVFNAPESPVNTPTVTPLTLALFLPFRDLPYRISQWLWLLVEYACLGLGFWAWARRTDRRHWLWGGLLTCLFCLTPHWRLHVDRGQSYVLYAALFLLVIPRSKPGKRDLWIEGLTSSLLTLLRPVYGILLGVGAARRRTTALLASGTGLLAWALLPVLLAGFAIWQNYFKAIAVHSRHYLEKIKFPPARFTPSQTIEGIPIDLLGGTARIPFADHSIYRFISFDLSPALLLGGWAVLAATAGFLMMRRGEAGTPRFWWILSAWILLGDYLLPAYRYSYNNILLWPVLLLGLAATTGRARTLWLGVSTALLTLHAATWFLPKSCIPWPGAATLVLAAVLAALSFRPQARASTSAA
jgi:Glycosyltransferase family 87